MKKKLLFLGFLMAVFAAFLTLHASAVTLPAPDAGCDFCRPTWEQVESHHCDDVCVCTFTTCPSCGEDTVLVYCSRTHRFGDTVYYPNGASTGQTWTYSLKCTQCFEYFNRKVINRSHSLNKTWTTVAPTCISYGYNYYYCDQHTDCRYTVDDLECEHFTFVEPLSHEFTLKETVAPGCGTQGYDLYECANCTLAKADHFVEGGDHTPTDAGTVTAPTCTTDGYTTHICASCGETYTTDKVIASGHKYTATVTPPTCTEGGHTTHTCSTCGDSYTDTQTTASGHSYTSTVVTAPGCTTTGTKKLTCSTCGNFYTETVAAAGHQYKETVIVPDCTEGGYTVYTCTACDDSYTGAEVAAAGHQYVSTVTAPTCTTGGFTSHVCSVCEDEYTDAKTVAAGHRYASTVTAPTCTARGYTLHTCSTCQDSYKDAYVDAAGHVEEPYGMDYRCTVCGNVRVVTLGIRAIGNIIGGFQIFGTGFATGAVDLFDGFMMADGELTTIASAAFALAGLALIGVIVYVVIRKFTKRM